MLNKKIHRATIIFIAVLLQICLLHPSPAKIADCKETNFQLWNKLKEVVTVTIEAWTPSRNITSLYNKVTINPDQTLNGNLQKLTATLAKDYPWTFQFTFNTANHTATWQILNWTEESKNMYVRIKEDEINNSWTFGQQTGPWKGLKKETASGCPLSKNLKINPILPKTIKQISAPFSNDTSNVNSGQNKALKQPPPKPTSPKPPLVQRPYVKQ